MDDISIYVNPTFNRDELLARLEIANKCLPVPAVRVIESADGNGRYQLSKAKQQMLANRKRAGKLGGLNRSNRKRGASSANLALARAARWNKVLLQTPITGPMAIIKAAE